MKNSEKEGFQVRGKARQTLLRVMPLDGTLGYVHRTSSNYDNLASRLQSFLRHGILPTSQLDSVGVAPAKIPLTHSPDHAFLHLEHFEEGVSLGTNQFAILVEDRFFWENIERVEILDKVAKSTISIQADYFKGVIIPKLEMDEKEPQLVWRKDLGIEEIDVDDFKLNDTITELRKEFPPERPRIECEIDDTSSFFVAFPTALYYTGLGTILKLGDLTRTEFKCYVFTESADGNDVSIYIPLGDKENKVNNLMLRSALIELVQRYQKGELSHAGKDVLEQFYSYLVSEKIILPNDRKIKILKTPTAREQILKRWEKYIDYVNEHRNYERRKKDWQEYSMYMLGKVKADVAAIMETEDYPIPVYLSDGSLIWPREFKLDEIKAGEIFMRFDLEYNL